MPPFTKIQQHTYVVCLNAVELKVTTHSDNLKGRIGRAVNAGAKKLLTAAEIFGESDLSRLQAHLKQRNPSPFRLTKTGTWGDESFQAIPYYLDREIVLEIEARRPTAINVSRSTGLRTIAKEIPAATTIPDLVSGVCKQIKDYLGLERVMLFQLDKGGGTITVEHRVDDIPALYGLRFRYSDFPLEAHQMHQREPVLSYVETGQPPVKISGLSEEENDVVRYHLGGRMAFSVAREFLVQSNLRTQLTVSLHIDGEIWGVISGHHREPLYLDYQARTFAHMAGILASHGISSLLHSTARRDKLLADTLRLRLRENIALATNLIDGLTAHKPNIMDLIPECNGVAVFFEGRLEVMGTPPPREQLAEIVAMISEKTQQQEIFHTDHLPAQLPSATAYVEQTAGVLSLPLNTIQSEWILWFRPENVKRVVYGSTPAKKAKRFARMTEIQKGHCLPWTPREVSLAQDLQSYLQEVVMQRYAKLRRMNQQLQKAYEEMESFSYTVSHDLRAPLRGIDGFAEIFLEEYGKGLNDDARELVHAIQSNAARMNQFITDILELSRAGRAKLIVNHLDVKKLVGKILPEIAGANLASVQINFSDDMPPILGDERQLKTVFRNLIGNAIKYSSEQSQSTIDVGFRPSGLGDHGEFYITDNGIGIAPEHFQRVFGMFNRLVSDQEYGGTGVGLAIVKRILNHHGGDIRIEPNAGEGVTFLFYTDVPQLDIPTGNDND